MMEKELFERKEEEKKKKKLEGRAVMPYWHGHLKKKTFFVASLGKAECTLRPIIGWPFCS